MNLILKNEIIQNNNLSDYTLLIYIALLKNYRKKDKLQIVTPCLIDYLLTGKITQTLSQKKKEKISSAFNELKEYANIKISNCDGKKSYVVLNESLKVDFLKESYTFLDFDNIEKIMKLNQNLKYGVFRYYIFILSLISRKVSVRNAENTDTKDILICNDKISDLSYASGVSEFTIMKYNKIFMDKELIYVSNEYNISYYNKETNQYFSNKNYYGRYEDKEYIEKYILDKYRNAKIMKNKKMRDKSRSLTQRYRYLVKNPDTDRYSDYELQEIYDYLSETNNKIINAINKYEQKYSDIENDSFENHIKAMKDRIKDLSIFDKFDFIEK